MIAQTQAANPKVDLVTASSADEPVLANLLQLYVHDFCDLVSIEIGDDGRFAYPSLSSYWTNPEYHAFLIKADSLLAGFVLVSLKFPASNNAKTPTDTHDIQEFFILRTYRRRRIGKQAAHAVWRRFPGPWQVRVRQSNTSAIRFWSAAIAEFTGATVTPTIIQKDGQPWDIYSFQSHLLK